MGLDTFLYAVRKPTKEEADWMANTSLSEIRQTSNYLVFEKKRVEREPHLYVDMQSFWIPLTTTEIKLDWMRMLADHGVSCDDYVVFSGQNVNTDKTLRQICFGFASGAEIKLTKSQYESYLITDISDVYVVARDEIARCRNNWDTIDSISNIRTQRQITQSINSGDYDELRDIRNYGICNCGYYVMDEDEKELIRPDIEPEAYNDLDNKVVALCAWW